jgi:hypothetical protein
MMAMMIDAALRALVLAAMVGAGLQLLRVTNVPVRKAAWTSVLVLSLAVPFVIRWPAVSGFASRFGWIVPIHSREVVPIPPETAIVAMQAPPAAVISADPMVAEVPRSVDDATLSAIPMTDLSPTPAATPLSAQRRTWHWPPLHDLVPIVYLAVSGGLLLRLVWGLIAACWIWSRAEEVSPLVAPEPNVRVSGKIPSPVTIGRGVVLPASYTEWTRSKLRVVLAHERSHVRQMDFYLQLLAGLYTALFWFSPLGWWLRRTLSALGEAISDRAGMQAALTRSDYADVLLEFAALPRRALPGVAMARSGNLSRRVEGLLNETLFRKSFAEGRRRAVVSLLLIPAALFAVTALVRVPGAAAQAETAEQTSPSPVAAVPLQDQTPAQPPVTRQSHPSESQRMTIRSQTATAQNPAAPQTPQIPPTTDDTPQDAAAPTPAQAPQAAPFPSPANPKTAPTAPPAPDVLLDSAGPITLDAGPMPRVFVDVPKMPGMNVVLPKTPEINALVLSGLDKDMTLFGPSGRFYFGEFDGMNGFAYHFSSNGDSWAIVNGTGNNPNVSGSGMPKDQLDLAQRMAKGPFLWFSHQGKSYVVDDPAIVARIQSLYAPMKDLGRQEEAIGVQQRVLGRMEGEMARQERQNTNVRIPDLSKEMADAKTVLDSLQAEQGQTLSEEKLGQLQARFAEMEARLGSLEARAAVQNNFGEKMRALGEQQRQLGEQERQLGEQQKKLADQAQQQVQIIIEQSLQNGKAAPLSPGK